MWRNTKARTKENKIGKWHIHRNTFDAPIRIQKVLLFNKARSRKGSLTPVGWNKKRGVRNKKQLLDRNQPGKIELDCFDFGKRSSLGASYASIRTKKSCLPMTRELLKPHAKVKQFTPFLEPKCIKVIIRRRTEIVSVFIMGATQWSPKNAKSKIMHYTNFHKKREILPSFQKERNIPESLSRSVPPERGKILQKCTRNLSKRSLILGINFRETLQKRHKAWNNRSLEVGSYHSSN